MISGPLAHGPLAHSHLAHSPLAPCTSHSSLSPDHTVLWLPVHLIQAFLQTTQSSGSLYISFKPFSRPHSPLAPCTSHSSLSPDHTVLWLPVHLIQAFLQTTQSSGSLYISFKPFSRPHSPLAPYTSNSSLSPDHAVLCHTVLWLPVHLIQAFLQTTQSSGSLYISFKPFSRPHSPLAPCTSHSSLSPDHTVLWHTVLWLPVHLIQAFLQTTQSSGSLYISFKPFSRPHSPLAPCTSHSSLSPDHTVLWLPVHLIQAFLQTTQSSGSLYISFKPFSRPHSPLAPCTSHSSLSPDHTVLWLPIHLIQVFLQTTQSSATQSSGSLYISFKPFSRPHSPLAPCTSHSSLSPDHTVLWLPVHLIQAFLQTTQSSGTQSSGSLYISFKPFSRPHSPLAPCTSHSSLSPDHTVLWLPVHLIQAFLQATQSSGTQTPGSLYISFKPFSRPHSPLAPYTSQSSLSPDHTVLWLPIHLNQAFLQTTQSSGSLYISFKPFSRPHSPLAPCRSHSSLSPDHTVLWLPVHLIQAFLQTTQSSGSLYISFKPFSRPHGPLAPCTSHSSLSPDHTVLWHTVLWLPVHLNQAFLQTTQSSGSLYISFKPFSRPHSPLPHSPLAPCTSHSSLSPGHTVLWHTVLWLPVHLNQAFLQTTQSSGSLYISFKPFSRPHSPLAPCTSHSSLSPGHTVLWLPVHLIQAFLQTTQSSGSLYISFKPFSRPHSPLPHSPLAPCTSHSSLSPGHTVLWHTDPWLPVHLIQAFLQATQSSGSLYISFKPFSRPHSPLAPCTSHSSLSPDHTVLWHTVLWLPVHLIQAFLQATQSSGSLYISFKPFSRPHSPLAPCTSHSRLSPGHTVLWLPVHLIQAFLQTTQSSGSLYISFKPFSRPHSPLAPCTSHSSLSPGHTVLWLPVHLIQAFLQTTQSSGSLYISFKPFSRPHSPLAPYTSHSSLSPDHTVLWLPVHLIQAFLQTTQSSGTQSSGSLYISFTPFSRPHSPLAPCTSHSSLSPGHTVLWLPVHLIQAFLQTTQSSGSLYISFKPFSRPHSPLAPCTSHSSLSPDHTVLWLPVHLIQAFLQTTQSSGSLYISFKPFSRPHSPLAPCTSHSSLSPDHTVLWLPVHLIQAFLQTTRSSGSLYISFKPFSRPHSPLAHSPLAPCTSHSSLSPDHTVLWLPVHLIQAFLQTTQSSGTQSSGSLYISFKLIPVLSFTSSNHCLAGVPRHFFYSQLCHARWCLSEFPSLTNRNVSMSVNLCLLIL